MIIPPKLWTFVSAACVIIAVAGACRRADPPTTQSTAGSVSTETALDPLGELDRISDLAPPRVAELCEAAAGKLTVAQRVTFYVKMEDSMIHALHRGDVMYGRIMPGGAGGFASQNGFRAVVYRDGYNTIWSYGDVTARETKRLKECS